jgi:hypothetical protein
MVIKITQGLMNFCFSDSIPHIGDFGTLSPLIIKSMYFDSYSSVHFEIVPFVYF